MNTNDTTTEVKKSACILCSINCGLDIQTGGLDGRELIKIKGDKENVHSEGYVCNKAARLNHYQTGTDRLTSPMRRKSDGSYEEIDWATAIREVASGLKAIKEKYDGDKIYFIGGGGQGNHLGGVYSTALNSALGVKYQTNPLAQEKTGEFWVQGKMFGGGPHGDFHHTEVAVFLGKNPWQTHGFPQTRKVLRDISKDPARSMIVIDPSNTDTAKMADFHLAVKPATDAWCISAMIATILQEQLEDTGFIETHTTGFNETCDHFKQISIADYAHVCGVDEALIRKAARRIATAKSVAIFEDLGIQQNVNSTAISYLQRILWIITGNFAIKGGMNISVPLLSITDASKPEGIDKKHNGKSYKTSPVLGSRVITGLLPCNEVPDEILTDHPDRFRAAIIQSSNPAHSFADSNRMREAILALEFSVVIDVAMTETARLADYILPASSQYEKHECTFFSIEFPDNYFHLRHPIISPLKGTLPESEIHTRLLEELGEIDSAIINQLKGALEKGRQVFGMTFMGLVAQNPKLLGVAPALLYRSLGPTINEGRSAEVAPMWAVCHQFAQKNTKYAKNAGFEGGAWEIGESLFEKMVTSVSGFKFSSSETYEDSWKRIKFSDKKIRLYIEELYPVIKSLDASHLDYNKEYPLILSAGNRRGTTANTIIRDASWDKKNELASLLINTDDAEKLNLIDGDVVKVITKSGEAKTYVKLSDRQREGTIALPNGVGLKYRQSDGCEVQVGIAPNELTTSNDKDFFAGTPWHKFIPARVEKFLQS